MASDIQICREFKTPTIRQPHLDVFELLESKRLQCKDR